MEISEVSNRILVGLLQARTGQELSESRQWRIASSLSGLFREHGIGSVDQLISMLTHARESSLARKVVEAMLNNETYFFRDRQMFDLLRQRALPQIAQRRAGSRKLSIWSVGCSTGQEALSLAMMLADQEAAWAGWSIDILATDVSQSVVEIARQARYSPFQVQRGLGVSQMIKWFDESPDGWQAQDRLRRMVRFKVHNILEPLPAPQSFDIILCRNVLLYFDTANRRRAFDRLAAALDCDGMLMLGVGETVTGQTECFLPDPEMLGLYRHAEHPSLRGNHKPAAPTTNSGPVRAAKQA